MLARLQRGLETLYRLEPRAQVDDFLIDSAQREAAGVARSPREQLLFREDEDGWAVGLYLDAEILAKLRGGCAAQLVAGRDLGDFLMLLEGVSHFVYVAFRANKDQQVSALELELQAEVDKYVTCLLSAPDEREHSERLRVRLFEQVEYDVDLCVQEQERYRVANSNALRYSKSLERRFVRPRKIHEMLAELRRFYRMGLRGKMQHIERAA